MENANDLPQTDVDGMSADEVLSAKQSFDAAMYEHPEHPYRDTRHPSHDAWVAYRQNLIAREVLTEKSAAPPDTESALDALETAARPTASTVAEAQAEIDAAVALGFDIGNVDADTARPDEVAVWKMQRLASEGSPELVPLMEAQLRQLGAPADMMAIFSQFAQNKNIDQGLRGEIVAKLIEYVHRGNHALHVAPKVDRGADLRSQIDSLRATPGYGDGTLANTNRPLADEITKTLTALYEKLYRKENDDGGLQGNTGQGGGNTYKPSQHRYGAGESYGRRRKVFGR
jgi:hypothetical protein